MAAILALVRVVRVAATGARASVTETAEAASESSPRPRIVGESAAMQRLLRVVARIGPKDITVLVRGETGTGKELIASLVHARSARSSGLW